KTIIALKMKSYNFQFLIFNFQWILLLFSAACHSPRVNDEGQLLSIIASDTLWQSTGNAKLDSLLQLATTAPQDTNLVKVFVQIADLYEFNDFEKAKEYYSKSRDLSNQLDWNWGIYRFYSGVAIVLTREGLMDSALVIARQGVEWARKAGNKEWIAALTINTGSICIEKGWNETALQYFMEALPFCEKDNNKRRLAVLYLMMGRVYRVLNIMEKASEYCEKAYTLSPENETMVLDLSNLFLDKQQYEKADGYFGEALRISIQKNNLYLAGVIYHQLSCNSLRLFDLEKAEKYIHKTFEINKEVGNTVYYHGSYVNLGVLEKLKGNFAQAEKNIKEALPMFIELDMTETQKICYMYLAELSTAQHNHRQNMQYNIKVDSVENVLAREKSLRAAEEMSAKYETEKKEHEIERQQQIISRQNLQRGLLAGGVAVSVIFVTLLWLMLRLRNRRNRALADINATKDKFFNIISHDLKNPATAQRDALKLLAENTPSWSTEQLSAYHNELLKSAEGQVELIYNLLGWSQVQTGRITCNPHTFALSKLLSDLSLIRGMAENKGITFVTQIPDGNATITADSNILTTVVRNLLTNAVKYTHAGGEVTLEASPNPSKGGGFSPPSGELEGASSFTFTVTDTGIGISREQLNSLFRIDNQHSRKGTAGEQGTGLGLIACRELLEKHGSALHIESEEGKGSKFWFTV
ncbi:MAG: hypothetical protein LBE79_02625, partial [Tannerella sp.]|nr:hypothetical protein [Tannerella sp.]